ncbi:alpha/beta fold hydrolase [Cellulomonas sp. Leaf334]|uniref:alpha/beta fold hydrolase n=1 Tax=Cellulomonas sp. Leaf334 TaxID=1736339 RepID=UPI0009EA15EA|nr:alpha/beta fold hydrolase [Cellulomonas sp. Leaf334]
MAAPSSEKSTTVRTQLPPIPPAVRSVVGALDRVAPELVARGALRLWCTPARTKDRTTIPGGIAFRTGPIAGQIWGDGPTVYLVHGWGGHRGQLRSLVGPLVDAGLRVVAYDAPAHGESGPGELGGRRTTLPEMSTALDTVIAAHGPARAVVGHSMGAAASALAVLDGTSTERLVLVTPLADPTTYIEGFAHTLGFSERTRHRFEVRMQVLASRRLADLDVPLRAANTRLPLPTTLVLSDRDDKEADHADGARIARAWPGAELVMSDGLGHRRILRDEETIKRIVAHVS